jgi:hypothetical protein
MRLSDKQTLISLEKNLVNSIKQYNDYEFDLTIEDNDFSKEILLIKVLNNFDHYKRAIIQFDQLSIQNLGILEDQVETKVKEIKTIESQKFRKLLSMYFSDNRLRSFFHQLEVNTFENSLEDFSENESISSLTYILKLIDNMNIATNSNFSIYSGINDLFQSSYDTFEKLIYQNQILLRYYSEHVANISRKLLIPNDSLNEWWFQIHPLTQSAIENAFSEFYEKQNQNSYVAELVVELGDKSSKVINEIKDEIENALDWGRGNLDSFDAMLNEFMNNKQTSPAYATWSDSENKPASSDHAMSAGLLKRISSISNEIIIELIGIAKDPDSELEETKRNQIIATAYLMIGETQKALDILDSE